MIVKKVLNEYVNSINIVFMNGLEGWETRKTEVIRAWSSKSENEENEELEIRERWATTDSVSKSGGREQGEQVSIGRDVECQEKGLVLENNELLLDKSKILKINWNSYVEY